MFAADLITALSGPSLVQIVAPLRDGPRPHVEFAVPVAPLPRGRLKLPGLGVVLATAVGLRRLIAHRRPHILHAHGGEALKYAVLASAGTGTRILYRRIAAVPAGVTHGPRRAMLAWLMRRADQIVTVSDSIRLETTSVFRVSPSAVVTIPRGVDGDRISPSAGREATRRSLGISGEAPVLLSLGALSPEKDPMAHLEIAGSLAARLPSFAHLIVGDGPLRASVEQKVRRLGIESVVRLLGVRSDIGDLLAASDVMVLASRTEGMPGVLIEAGMAGVPVVAYNVGGVGEVVEHGITGTLVTPGDIPRAIVELETLLMRHDMRRAMGEAARNRCQTRFEIGAVAARYRGLYAELAEGYLN
jgi:glycosyltransferase involved in cell wall biosynthesis